MCTRVQELYKEIGGVIAAAVDCLRVLTTFAEIRHAYNEAWAKDDYLKVAATALCLGIVS